MIQQLKQFEEWEREIAKWHKYHKGTSPGTTTLIKKRFEKYKLDYFRLTTEYRQTKKKSVLLAAEKVFATAEAEFVKFKRLEFLGTLSK
jgi:hypothetical protein